MSTIQIVGIAVAAVIVALLVIALIVTRKSGADQVSGADESAVDGSFLDSAPTDTLAKLGRAEHVRAPARDPRDAAGRAATPPATIVRTATGVASGTSGGLGLDWDNSGGRAAAPAAPDETETTGEMPAVAVSAEQEEPDVAAPAAPEPPALTQPAGGASPAADVSDGAGEPEPSDTLVPLSSIIVTTSTKMVDLKDPEIRRMLTDLVTFEIDQATQFREQGRSIDAVLQLTEAEKICRALGKHDTAHEIRQMMRGLQD